MKTAIDAGYRFFDGAYLYGNERQLGQAIAEKIKNGVVERKDLFISSKVRSLLQRVQNYFT